MKRLLDMWRTPVGRGYIMLAVMSAAFGLAFFANEAILTNYYQEILHLKGPMFGYITAIREVPGFLLIFLTALFYRVSRQWLTAFALVALGVGLGGFTLATDFWTVIPWVVISSAGLHTVLQSQYSLGMSLAEESESGRILGKMAAIVQGGALAGTAIILFVFLFEVSSFHPVFLVLGGISLIGAVAIVGFPHLHQGRPGTTALPARRLVFRRDYRYYYLLNALDGARQQLFFSFGLWVLVNHYHLSVASICVVLLAAAVVGMVSSSWAGRMLDRYGERRTLSLINVAYIVALGGYALANNVILACLFFVIYYFIMPLSPIGAATYLRKIAVPEDIAPGLAMGVTFMHATAIVVPVVAGIILNFVGYQVPFFIACGFACVGIVVILRLDPTTQRSAARVALDASNRGAEHAVTGGAAGAVTAAESGAVLLATDGGVGGEVATPNAPRSSLEEPEGSD